MSEPRDPPVRIRDGDEPRNATELLLRGICLAEPPVTGVGVHDDFFASTRPAAGHR
ncbi:hypothetical protein [Streptomyces cinereospinus]|uniref:Uncharacterized protein n=1 Tax=Streptomyces cinereospinus TaxID=285561 RepID=A0ABV5N716_9ACTN